MAMRIRRHVSLLQSALTRVASRQLAPSLCARCRRYASSKASPENIAVLGGGVSGLSSAYFVAKEFPNSKITVYESGKEAGGWVKSPRVQVPGGNVVFEYGPRTLRPAANCKPTAQLIQELGLVDNVLYSPKTSAAAKNRFIYYPDRLNRLPAPGESLKFGDVMNLVQSGLTAGIFNALLEPFRPGRNCNVTDSSMGIFIARRFDRRLANNVLSAVMHGIYAGDVWKLSAKTLLSTMWQLEGLHGSIVTGLLQTNSEVRDTESRVLTHPYIVDTNLAMRKDIKLDKEFAERLAMCSVFSFRNGLEELIKTLQRKLEDSNQVQFKLGTYVRDMKYIGGSTPQMEVSTGTKANPETQKYDLVISSLREKSLAPYVTVMTVNLYFSDPKLLPVEGFGYLIPQSVPFEQNPERALGVIFDSDAMKGQDTVEGTKITVMLGGHWWDGWEAYPTKEEGLEYARSILRRHLGIKAEPVVSRVNLSKDCIPQYTVGFDERLKNYAQKVKEDYRGRVRMVGNLYHGVGVNDCISASWMVARGLRGSGWKERATGLEKALDDRPWVAAPTGGGLRDGA